MQTSCALAISSISKADTCCWWTSVY